MKKTFLALIASVAIIGSANAQSLAHPQNPSLKGMQLGAVHNLDELLTKICGTGGLFGSPSWQVSDKDSRLTRCNGRVSYADENFESTAAYLTSTQEFFGATLKASFVKGAFNAAPATTASIIEGKMIDGYGQPTSVDRVELQNGYGARFPMNRTMIWEKGNFMIVKFEENGWFVNGYNGRDVVVVFGEKQYVKASIEKFNSQRATKSKSEL